MSVRSVLCPFDFDGASEAALKLAVDQAKARGATLDLLHVWQPGAEYTPDEPPIPFSAKVPEDQIRADLLALAVDLPEEKVRCHVSCGTPSHDIVELAAKLDSELVVMGTHARTGLRHWFVGSVCEWVLHHCPCPILVCRGPESESDG